MWLYIKRARVRSRALYPLSRFAYYFSSARTLLRSAENKWIKVTHLDRRIGEQLSSHSSRVRPRLVFPPPGGAADALVRYLSVLASSASRSASRHASDAA